MRNTILVLCTAVSLTVPTLTATGASADSCEAHAEHRRVAGTILGGLAGAVIGNQISHRGGALVGGIGGAVVGNQLSRTSCDRRAYYRRGYEPAVYQHGYGPAQRCGMQDQVYYDAGGNPIHRQVQVCR